MRDLHHLDLVELVLADHAARVLAVAPRLRAEARRVRGEPDRQRLRVEDLAADRVRERDLGGRDQVERLRLALLPALPHREHVGLELRQLRRADERLGVDDVGRVALDVAVLARLDVEHELRERAVQAREPAAQEREARARELRGRLEVEQAEALAEVRVILHREVERARRPPAADLDVVVGRPADWRRRVREVRQPEQEVAQLRLHAVELGLERLQRVAEPRDLGEQRRGVRALALGDADLLRQRVAPALQVLRARLDVLALALERLERRGVERDAALRQAGGDGGKVVTEQVDVEHFVIVSVTCRNECRCDPPPALQRSSSRERLRAAASRERKSARRWRMRSSSPRSVGS